jgi:lipopolysaccharide export system permease protein
MMTKIWQRYFLKETLKTFLLIIFCFYGLYILIDFASHSSQHYHHSSMDWSEFIRHYANEWVQRMDVLVPFALMIASVRTLCDLNIHNELVALRSSGVPIKTLLRPFVLIGLFFTLFMYLNTQWLLPEALANNRRLQDEKTLQKNEKNNKFFVQHIGLKDQSTLLFQHYDSEQKRFFDAYWIHGFDEIWRFQYLYPYQSPPLGMKVDLFKRAPNGSIYKEASYDSLEFTDMRFNKKTLLDTLTPPNELSLTTLWKKLPPLTTSLTEKQAETASTFFHKLAIPWLCMLAILAPAPFCVRYNRTQPIFYIYALSLFALVTSYLVFNAAHLLGSRQAVSPILALGVPFSLCFLITLRNFIKLK